MPKNRSFLLVLACFGLSGMAGLVYETVWTEQFSLVLGASELAVATVLGAYMAGLAVGAAVARRWVNRVTRPVRVYALLELGIAALALAVPLGLKVASQLQVRLLGGLETAPDAGGVSSALFYVVATFAILLVPTALMGATLPLLARYAVERPEDIGTKVGWLYTANTVGAGLGTLLAAFVLLPNLGLGQTVLIAVAINGLVFVLATRLDPGTEAQANPEPERSLAQSSGAIILPMILVSGFVSFTWEVLWTRLLGQLLGGTVYAFGAMLATFLVGIALGSAIATRFAGSERRARVGFATAQIGMAALSLGAYHSVDLLPGLVDGMGAGGGASLLRGVLLAGLTLLPGAICVGATYPFAVRILTSAAAEAGPASARVYAWNTVGSILGAIAAGFVLLPSLGFAGTALLSVSLSLVLAFALAVDSGPPARRWLIGSAVAVLLVLLVFRPSTPWQVLRTSPMAGGATNKGDVLFFEVGRSANVMVYDELGRWRLSTNGLPEAAVQLPGARVGRFTAARWMSVLPLLSRPETSSLLVVGMGAALTLEDVPATINQIDVIELEPEVVAANQMLAGMRKTDPLSDPRLTVHINDARSALTLSDRQYDAIVSQPSHPWTSGSSHLFTREFFQLISDRLSPDGVFVQWMGLRYVDAELLRTLVATLCETFAHVEVYQPFPGGSVLFLSSQEPLSQADVVDRGYQTAGSQWLRMGLLDAQDVLLDRRLTSAASRRFSAGAPINTDHRNRLKIRSPKILDRPIGSRGAYSLLADFDSFLDTPEQIDFALIRRLSERKHPRRALNLADLLPPAERVVAFALIEMERGRGPSTQGELRRVFAAGSSPSNKEAMYALLQLNRAVLLRQGVPPQLQGSLDPEAELILKGWRLLAEGKTEALQALEPRLEGVDRSHALHRASTALRIQWRQRAQDRQYAQEALDLLEPRLAFGATAAEMIQWIQLARLAEQHDRAIAGASDLIEMAVRNPNNDRLKQRAIEVVRMLPTETHRSLQ